MLKDLEKRRSRDLETSSSLSQNITWETRPNQKSFNWIAASIIIILIGLISVIGYLLWERNSLASPSSISDKKHVAAVKSKQVKQKKIKKPKIQKKVKTEVNKPVEPVINEDVDVSESIDVEEANDLPPIKLKKKHHPLNNKQLAEIAYNKGYKLLQQGRMHQGKQLLREALSLYIPHINCFPEAWSLAGLCCSSGLRRGWDHLEAAEPTGYPSRRA